MSTTFIVAAFILWTIASLVAGFIYGVHNGDKRQEKLIQQLRETIKAQAKTIEGQRGIIGEKNKGTSK